MVFDPAQSIDLIGHTGPFIQYAYTRIQSLLNKWDNGSAENELEIAKLEASEKKLIQLLDVYPAKVKSAATNFDPSEVANYAYELAKTFNKFYAELPILKDVEANIKTFRLQLSQLVGQVLLSSMSLLGIELPEKM